MLLRKSAFTLAIALTLGVGAAVLAQKWLHERAAVAASQGAGVPVVVAAAEIAFGQKLEATHLKTISWPAGSVPEGAFEKLEEVVGRTANQKIYPGEPVLSTRASRNAAGSSLAGLIEPRKRAVTVRVNDVIGVAGFLLPGNRVDLLASRRLDNKRYLTRTLLEDIKVLAVDQSSSADKDKAVVVRAVTLEVDRKQAEALVQATEEGSVQLALRNPDEPAPLIVAEQKPVLPLTANRSTVTVIRQTQVGQASAQY